MIVARLAALAALVLGMTVPSPAGAAQVNVDCPSAALQPGASFPAAVAVDVGDRPLGAYTLAITYDPGVVAVTSIAGGSTVEFGSPPITNSSEFQSGRTRFLAFNAASLTTPTGVVSVAAITFHVLGAPGSSTPLALEIITLADTNGSRIVADTQGCSVEVSATTPATQASRTPTPTNMPTVNPTPAPTLGQSGCSGDCNGDGNVTVDELLLGINIALGFAALDQCPVFDLTGDRMVTVDELVSATNASLSACPATPTPSATPTASPTPTGGMNHAPVLPPFAVFHAYPGSEIRFTVSGTDPDGDGLHYTAQDLPEGAELNQLSGLLSWTPREDQLGPFFVRVSCTDEGTPPESVQGLLVFQVLPPDSCTVTSCDPATGCESELVPIQNACCTAQPQSRPARALVACPEGRALFVGRNNAGFGRLQDCDRLRVINFLQVGAGVRFNAEARCVNAAQPVMLHARLETAARVVFDRTQSVRLQPREDGYAEKLAVVFPVAGQGPFFEFEGADALLSVTLTDADGVVVGSQWRLTLTFDALDDLPETEDRPPPTE